MTTINLREHGAPAPKNACSFCLRVEEDVKVLIHGRNRFICDECVEDINQLLKDEVEETS